MWNEAWDAGGGADSCTGAIAAAELPLLHSSMFTPTHAMASLGVPHARTLLLHLCQTCSRHGANCKHMASAAGSSRADVSTLTLSPDLEVGFCKEAGSSISAFCDTCSTMAYSRMHVAVLFIALSLLMLQGGIAEAEAAAAAHAAQPLPESSQLCTDRCKALSKRRYLEQELCESPLCTLQTALAVRGL